MSLQNLTRSNSPISLPSQRGRYVKIVQIIAAMMLFVTATVGLPADPAAAAAGNARLFVVGSQEDGFAILGSGNQQSRQWVDKECRGRLEAAGMPVERVPYSSVTAVPETTDWLDCAEFEAHIGDGDGGDGGDGGGAGDARLFVVGSQEDGFAILGSGNQQSRQWVDKECRGRLEAAGMPVERVPYSSVTAVPKTTNWLTCQELVDRLGGGGGGGGSQPGKRCMGINDGFASSWTGGHLAADAFKNGRGPYIKGTYSPPVNAPTDADKWPVGGQAISFVLGEGSHRLEAFNPWILLPYQQSGALAEPPANNTWKLNGATFVGRYESNGVKGLEFKLEQRNAELVIEAGQLPPSGRNRWHLVPKSVAADYAAAMKAENFKYIFSSDKYGLDPNFPLLNPQTKAHASQFCRIRMMAGDKTNTTDFNGRRSNRATPSQPTWNTPGGDGVPYEWEVWIANHLGVDLWHTDHIRTWEGLRQGDPYLWNQANYMERNLTGDLIREYGNEIWNFAWPFNQQSEWVRDRTPGFSDLNNAYGKRAFDTAAVWEQVWRNGGRRNALDLTIATQTANPGLAVPRLVGPSGERWHARADSLSLNSYFGSSMRNGNGSNINQRNYQAMVRTYEQGGAAAVRRAMIADHAESLRTWKTKVDTTIGQVKPYVDEIHIYEGSSHTVLYAYDKNNAKDRAIAEQIRWFRSSAQYENQLTDMYNWWASRPMTGEVAWYSLYGTNSPASPWGHYSSSAATNPTYAGEGRFVRDYIRRN